MNDNVKEILQILSEECAEVIQAISKCYRFGPDHIKPNKAKTNIAILEEELGDLLAMIDLLVNQDVGVTLDGLIEAKTNKFNKLKCWSNIKT
jgi:NTP pyrophosphatase (non-canonical NTP hydrolase)